jgi:Domain of unknown function (DUF5753)
MLARLARHTKEHGWWHPYSQAAPGHSSIYTTLEETASSLLGYATCQVPDLLRTEDYARALITSSHPDGADTSQLVRECLARQALITRATAPLQATVILSETILRRPAGGAKVMAGQLRHLAELAALPDLWLRVVPFSAGTHPGLSTGPFTLLDFPPASTGTSQAIVHAASLTGELYLDKPHEIRDYREAHAAILRCSLSETASRDLLRTAANELDQ